MHSPILFLNRNGSVPSGAAAGIFMGVWGQFIPIITTNEFSRAGKEKRVCYAGPEGIVHTPPLQASPDAQSLGVLQDAPGAPVLPGPPAPEGALPPDGAGVAGDGELPADFGSTQYPPLHESPPIQSELWTQSLFSSVVSVHFPQFMHGRQA